MELSRRNIFCVKRFKLSNLVDILKNLGPGKILALGTVMLGLLGFLTYLISSASTPGMAPLFSQLEPAEAGRILEKLDSMGIPNESRGDGTQIYVPSDRVARIRMEMAQEGLPSGGTIGYEIFDKTDILSASGSMIDINKLRALEGEIAKSIKTIHGVAAARVHLVTPKRELFSRDKVAPSASVMLKMRGSSRLSASQVQAVQHLVSSAVPELGTDHIAIIDNRGTLLAKNHDGQSGGENMLVQLDAKSAFENKLARTVETLLEKSLGAGKARVEVAADMDFDRVTINSEDFNPDGQVIRSTSNTSEDSNHQDSSGGNVSIQNALPEQQGAGGGGKSGGTSKGSQENINYEISKTIKVQHKESGSVKHLSVAVLVDGSYTAGKDGKAVYAPRPQEELDKIKLLVKTAIGFKEDRGDKVEIVNMPFTSMEIDGAVVPESMMNWIPKVDLTRIIQFVILAIVGLVLLLLIVRPMIMKIIESNPAMAAVAAAGGLLPAQAVAGGGALPYPEANPQSLGDQSNRQTTEMTDPTPGTSPTSTAGSANETQNYLSESVANAMQSGNLVGEKLHSENFRKVSEIIDKYPEDVVTLLRTWMYDEPWKH